MTALLIADHDNVKLRPATASAVTALLQMTEAVDVLVAGNGCEAVAEEAAKIAGVRTVLLAQNAKLAQELPEVLAYTAAHEAPGYSHIFFCATALGKAAMPRVAAQLDRSAVSDVVAVKGPKTFVRGIYAGALLATVEVDEDVVVGTVRTTAFEPAGEADMPVRIENITVPEEAVNCALRKRKATVRISSRPKWLLPAGAVLLMRLGSLRLKSWPIKLVLPLEQPVLPSIWDFVPMIGR